MQTEKNGVGPHPRPWPKGDFYDLELLKNGDRRNVLDKYRYWTVEAIKKSLAESSNRLCIAIENWQHDFNIGTIVRTANAFNVEKVFIIGKKHWNRRGAMVTDRYMDIIQLETIDNFILQMKKDGKRVIAVDIVPGAKSLSSTKMPNNSVLVFGSEGPGISDRLLDLADDIVAIEQFGSTRSVNVGVAAGIVMYEWLKQNFL